MHLDKVYKAFTDTNDMISGLMKTRTWKNILVDIVCICIITIYGEYDKSVVRSGFFE